MHTTPPTAGDHAAARFLLPLLLLGSLALPGCESATEPRATGLSVAAGEAEYALPADGPVMVTFTATNVGADTVWVELCGGAPTAVVDRSEGLLWVPYTSLGACPAVYVIVPVPLSPGESLERVFRIHDPGRYRIRVATRARPGDDWAWATSSSFAVGERR